MVSLDVIKFWWNVLQNTIMMKSW